MFSLAFGFNFTRSTRLLDKITPKGRSCLQSHEERTPFDGFSGNVLLFRIDWRWETARHENRYRAEGSIKRTRAIVRIVSSGLFTCIRHSFKIEPRNQLSMET